MPDFTVIKNFRDRESDLKVFESGSLYNSSKKEWTDYLVKEGFLKSKNSKTSTVKKEEAKKEKPNRNTSKKESE